MTHLTEEQLVLHYYGEEPDAPAHLPLCSTCRASYQEIARVLDACREYPVPDPGPAFEADLWRNIQTQTAPPVRFFTPRRWMPIAAAILLAFFLGRLSLHTNPAAPQLTAAQGRERILFVALGDHLERSQMVLVELANATPAAASDIHLAQERARDLVSENRLYRQTAQLSGDREFLGLLDDLERVLTDIANSPSQLTSPQLQQIQQRIESRGLIFKIRVVDSNLQQKGTAKL